MSKKPSFLEALNRVTAPQEPDPKPKFEPKPAPQSAKGRAGQKHIGAYFDKGDPIIERVAILRARMDMTNSELIEHALNELWSRHEAGRAFGD